MLKLILLSGAMMISAPVLAQTAPKDAQAAPAMQAAPVNSQTAPQSTAPAAPDATTAAQPAPQTAQSAPTDTSAPADKGTQVAQVVDTEFATYDKDKNGTLSATEFDTWMAALKTAADPSSKATSPATKKWMAQAFTQADTDKNRKISKEEITKFLSSGQG